MRQIVLDTETTGIDPKQGHRIIEIGCVELVDRKLTQRHYHQYVHPDREVEQEAIDVHGITNEFLADKPRFGQVAEAFLEFVKGAELIIHNAAFDVGFLESELNLVGCEQPQLIQHASGILDTLKLARDLHPGQSNSLDALCRRYDIDNSNRTLHGALLDSEILAEVYLAMTGGQESFSLSVSEDKVQRRRVERHEREPTPVLRASDAEIAAHLGEVLWQKGEQEEARAVLQGAQQTDANNMALREVLERLGIQL